VGFREPGEGHDLGVCGVEAFGGLVGAHVGEVVDDPAVPGPDFVG